MDPKKNKSQNGFSLIELLVVVFLLSILVGAIFSQIDKAQIRYRVEDQKLDLTQQERDFIDQFTRDLHQAGYPSTTQYGGRFDLSSKQTAAGIWKISPTDLVYAAGCLPPRRRAISVRSITRFATRR